MFKKDTVTSFLIKLALLFVFLFSSHICNAAEQKQIIVVFRYDDYSNSSPTDIERQLIDDFRIRGLPCVFGVIPFTEMGNLYDAKLSDMVPLAETKIKILKDAIKTNVLEVAMHGYSHRNNQKNPHGSSEFYGVDYDVQLAKVLQGKQYLEEMLDAKISAFIPPWNSYDMNTMRVLERLRFDVISADRYGIAKEISSVKFLPETCDLSHLQETIRLARLVPDNRPVIVVLFHAYSFSEVDKKRSEMSYQDFLQLLDWTRSQKDVRVLSMDQSEKVIEDLSSRRFITWSKNLLFKWGKILPAFLRRPFPPRIYLSQDVTHRLEFQFCVLSLVFYLSILILSMCIAFAGGLLVFAKSKLITVIVKYCLPIAMAFVSFYVFYDAKFNYRGAIIIAVLLGSCVGTWSSLLRLKRKVD